jgi:hypothetical protein
LFLFIRSIGFFYLDTIFIGKPLQRFYITIFFMLHQKTDGIAASSATKTFIDLFGGGHGKRWSFFIMKGTEAKVIGASFFQSYKIANNVYNIKAAKYLLYGILRDHLGNGKYSL